MEFLLPGSLLRLLAFCIEKLDLSRNAETLQFKDNSKYSSEELIWQYFSLETNNKVCKWCVFLEIQFTNLFSVLHFLYSMCSVGPGVKRLRETSLSALGQLSL